MGQSGETAVVAAAAAARTAVALQVDPLPMPTTTTASVAPATAASVAMTYSKAATQNHQEPLLPTDTVIYFRKLVAADIDQVRALHETWFPIRYNQVRVSLSLSLLSHMPCSIATHDTNAARLCCASRSTTEPQRGSGWRLAGRSSHSSLSKSCRRARSYPRPRTGSCTRDKRCSHRCERIASTSSAL